MLKKYKGQKVETLEEEPLRLDLEIEFLGKLEGVHIETLGVYSYKAKIDEIFSPKRSNETSMFSKGQALQRSTGIIINIKMEGNRKKVSIES